MKLKHLGSFEKGVELGFGLRNEKDSLIERERSESVELGYIYIYIYIYKRYYDQFKI